MVDTIDPITMKWHVCTVEMAVEVWRPSQRHGSLNYTIRCGECSKYWPLPVRGLTREEELWLSLMAL